MKIRKILYLFMLLLTAMLSACQSEPETSPGVQPAPGMTVEITEDTCPGVIVAAGNPVTWVNHDDQEHLIHIETPEGELIFDSGALRPEDSVTFNFSQPGSYNYICSSDQDYSQTITVEP